MASPWVNHHEDQDLMGIQRYLFTRVYNFEFGALQRFRTCFVNAQVSTSAISNLFIIHDQISKSRCPILVT